MNLEEKYLNDAAAALFPEPEGIVEVGPLTKDEGQFSPTAIKQDGGVGFVEGATATPVSSSSTVQPVAAPSVSTANRVFPEDTASIQNIPRNTLQEMMGAVGSAIQSGADYLDFAVIGLPDVGTLSLKDLTVGDLGKVMEAMSYGFYPVETKSAAGIPLLMPTAEALDLLNAIPAFKAAGSALKYGARELAPAAANVIEQGLRKSGMIMDIVPDGKSITQQAAKSDIGFYSAVENAAINVQRKSGTGQSFLNDIIKSENVKAEEIKWMGLDEFLKGKKNVTKQEVQDYIANNKVDVKEVTLGGDKNTFTDSEKAIAYIGEREGWTPREVMENWGYADKKDYIDLANQMAQKDPINGSLPAQFGSYTLAGGENYREILLTMPDKKIMPDVLNEQYSFNTLPDGRVQLLDEGRLVSTSKDMAGAWSEAKAIGAIDYGKDKAIKFTSSHFDHPNILAHLRVNDRVDADGKKMLLIEEVQSDWHQAGRKKGYRSSPSEDDIKNIMDRSNYMSRADAIDYLTNNNAVPDAPFKDTWYQLALKRALQYAAENGYERVGLTTGKQQADRFDLSKQVDEIFVPMVNSDGTRSVRIEPTDGLSINLMLDKNGVATGFGQAGRQFTDKKIDEIVGKELADKIMKADAESKFSGVDLSVGGEGMKKYYDEIYPKFLEKYGKKWNAKMGETKIQTETSRDASGIPSMYPNKETVRYIDITPEMKAGVQKGQPLFAAAPIGAATGTAAMQDERKK